MNYTFNAKETTEKAAQWIREFFEKNGKNCNAVIGISGGKDSSICAALCVEALGKERVIGVLMPNGEQNDIDMARLLVNHLDIKAVEVNINEAYKGVLNGLENAKPVNRFKLDGLSNQTIVNLPPRLRMAVLYAVSQSCNGRVANT